MTFQQPSGSSHPLRVAIRANYLASEDQMVEALLQSHQKNQVDTEAIQASAYTLVEQLRSEKKSSSLIDRFLQEFTLSSEEGVVLMCMAEALLRIPDAHTADALIRDKLSSGNWESHLGKSESIMVNASTWGMMLTGKWLNVNDITRRDPFSFLHKMAVKSGEPAIRVAVRQAMKIMGQEFVLAETIHGGLKTAKHQQAKGFTYSYDMLGEAAKTQADAAHYIKAYADAIQALSREATSDNPILNPGISVKISALHSRYEFAQTQAVETELYEVLLSLAKQAKAAHIGFNIDAEEADRLESSLSLFEKLALASELSAWNGLGFVVQAYQKRALSVIEWLTDLAQRSQHKFMLRLVKGAYWDTEIKLAQTLGHKDYPVFTRKENTDLSYLVCAQHLLDNKDVFYAQFATHNARTVAAIEAYSKDKNQFEFQCLHGMGEALYEKVVADGYHCRIYAPVGEHKSLLAYLVRRLLENGANTSFVNMLADESLSIDSIIASPIQKIEKQQQYRHSAIPLPGDLYAPLRQNARGENLADSDWLNLYYLYLDSAGQKQYTAKPLLTKNVHNTNALIQVTNPATDKPIGTVQYTCTEQIESALESAHDQYHSWDALGGDARADILEKAADLYEQNSFKLIALCQLEAGKTLADGVAELREAVDFMRFYAVQARDEFQTPVILPGPTGEKNEYSLHARGVFVCISPWNFPLAIFTGQLSAALMAGNAVIVKPAEQTPLIASCAVKLLHQAGVPRAILQYLPGTGQEVGAALTADSRPAGVVFTGGTKTAQHIYASLSSRANAPLPHLIAETGGLNAMIVDSSALAEQVTTDVIASAFQSAGQRCSALRVLFIQEEVADELITMIKGAMAQLTVGDPTELATDVGPIIDQPALDAIQAHIATFSDKGLLARSPIDQTAGYYCAPALIEISDIGLLKEEVFGPVLHIVRYQSNALQGVIESINKTGYGLTLGIHSRINETIDYVIKRAKVGNIYVNRNIIGAVVGTQPFGGEGLSGTGPKAGGPHYLHRFAVERVVSTDTTAAGGNASLLSLASDG